MRNFFLRPRHNWRDRSDRKLRSGQINIQADNQACGRTGSALILTMFIMAAMLIAAMGGSYLVLLGIKAGGIQSQSTKAYFAAEAGIERLLWELRENEYSYGAVSETAIMTGDLSSDASYEIFFTAFPPLTFKAVGDFQNVRRSVEVRM